MATAKKAFISYAWLRVCAVVVNALLSALLVFVRYKCMSNKTNDTVESYCAEDNNMRAVVSAIISAIIFTIALALSSAVNSFRTYKLVTGINEGVFVAMGSGFTTKLNSLMYPPVGLLIMVVVFFRYAPESMQTFVTLATTTQDVYVMNNSTAIVVDEPIYYGRNIESAKFLSLIPQANSLSLLTTASAYGSPQGSSSVDKSVEVAVVRENFVIELNITDFYDDNSIKYTDVVANIRTTCSDARDVNEGIDIEDDKYVRLILGQDSYSASFVDSNYEVSGKYANITTQREISSCINSSMCETTSVSCSSIVSLGRYDMIYAVGTKKVTLVNEVYMNTAINISDFAEILTNIVTSPEDVAIKIVDVSSLANAQSRPEPSVDVSNLPDGSYVDGPSSGFGIDDLLGAPGIGELLGGSDIGGPSSGYAFGDLLSELGKSNIGGPSSESDIGGPSSGSAFGDLLSELGRSSTGGPSSEPGIGDLLSESDIGSMSGESNINNLLSGLSRSSIGDLIGQRDINGISANDVFNTINVLQSYVSFGTGRFDNILSNELNARTAAAAGLSLHRLMSASFLNASSLESVTIISPSSALPVRPLNHKNINLYNIVKQAYMPVYFLWLVVAIVTLTTVAMALTDLVCFHKSPINIKDVNELALIDNIDEYTRDQRLNKCMSNDPSEQDKNAFDRTLVVMEGGQKNDRVVIGYKEPNKHYKIPDKKKLYN